jgi:hypothetical protein
MFKSFAIHLGGGLFLSKFISLAENVVNDVSLISSDALPVVMEVTTIANAATHFDLPTVFAQVKALIASGLVLCADIHTIVATSVFHSTVDANSVLPVAVVTPIPAVASAPAAPAPSPVAAPAAAAAAVPAVGVIAEVEAAVKKIFN